MLPDEQPSPEQIKIFQRMSPEQRWQAANLLYWSARQHKTAFLRNQNPEWSDQEVEEEVRRIFLYAHT